MARVLADGFIKGGKIALDDVRTLHLDIAAAFGEGEAVVLSVESVQAAVSRQARGYYFGVVLKALRQYSGHTIDDLHAWAKAKFTPKHLTILDGNGRVVDDLVIGSTTTTFSPEEFFDYVEALRAFMLQRLNVSTPDPDPKWREKASTAA
jgi:hypothetical protein